VGAFLGVRSTSRSSLSEPYTHPPGLFSILWICAGWNQPCMDRRAEICNPCTKATGVVRYKKVQRFYLVSPFTGLGQKGLGYP
jgi:hypothetical protein